MVGQGLPAAPHSIGEYLDGYEQDRRLRGYASACGFVSATWALLCPQCGRRDLQERELASAGTVVAISVQHVPSDEFLNEAPYAYVLVELDGGGRISGWIDGANAADLTIGSRVAFAPGYKAGVHFERESP